MPEPIDERYRLRVWQATSKDALVQPLMRALHADLCGRAGHLQPHGPGGRRPLCARAYYVVVQWAADGRPETDPEA